MLARSMSGAQLLFLPITALISGDMCTLCWVICLHGFDYTLIKTCEASALWPCGQKALCSLSEPWFPELKKGLSESDFRWPVLPLTQNAIVAPNWRAGCQQGWMVFNP